MRKLALLVCALAAVTLANAQIFDDFNRPDGTNMGPNWNETTGDWRIEGNMGRGNGANVYMDWVGTPNTDPYYDVQASVDIFCPGTSLNYVALRTGVGTDELFIKVQAQTSTGNFSHIGFYHRTGANSFSAWAGGTGFLTIPAGQEFQKGRLTTYFKPGNTDTIYLDVDTDFNGVPEWTYTSPGVDNIKANLGLGVGIGGYGTAGANSNQFDNFRVVPEPTSLLLLGALLVLRRR